VRIRLEVTGESPVFIYCEGQPRPGDVMRLPAALWRKGADSPDRELTVSDLPSTWEVDDDGVLVPSFKATFTDA
jgi:hypothetical protein